MGITARTPETTTKVCTYSLGTICPHIPSIGVERKIASCDNPRFVPHTISVAHALSTTFPGFYPGCPQSPEVVHMPFEVIHIAFLICDNSSLYGHCGWRLPSPRIGSLGDCDMVSEWLSHNRQYMSVPGSVLVEVGEQGSIGKRHIETVLERTGEPLIVIARRGR